jgi:hypothetical protein
MGRLHVRCRPPARCRSSRCARGRRRRRHRPGRPARRVEAPKAEPARGNAGLDPALVAPEGPGDGRGDRRVELVRGGRSRRRRAPAPGATGRGAPAPSRRSSSGGFPARSAPRPRSSGSSRSSGGSRSVRRMTSFGITSANRNRRLLHEGAQVVLLQGPRRAVGVHELGDDLEGLLRLERVDEPAAAGLSLWLTTPTGIPPGRGPTSSHGRSGRRGR